MPLEDLHRTIGPAEALLLVAGEMIGREAFSETLAGAFREAMKRAAGQLRLLGPAECPVFKLNDFFRFHFQVQSDSSAVLHSVLREVLTVAKVPSGVEFQVDVDPYNML